MESVQGKQENYRNPGEQKNSKKSKQLISSFKQLPGFDKFLIFLVILLSVLGPIGIGAVLIGYINPWLVPIGLFGINLPLVMLLLYVLVASFISWPKYFKEEFPRRFIPFSLVFLAIFDVVMFIQLPFFKPFVYGFKLYAAQRADLPEIRTWLDGQREKCAQEYNVNLIGVDEVIWPADVNWPYSLKKFRPHHVRFLKDDDGNPMLEIIYGGGMGHWGLVIGNPNLVIPQVRHKNAFAVLSLDKGSYVWAD